MKTIPPYLKKGDKIGIVAPAGFMPVDRIQTCVEILDGWGYSVQLGASTHSNSLNYFSGTDEERLKDLQWMLDDMETNAILCARGGYGVSRLIDRLNFKSFKKSPKWIIGFSDITVLHTHLYRRYKIASMHAPMAAAFNEGELNNPYLRSLQLALEGIPANYQGPGHEFNRKGKVKAVLVGGNLSLLTHLMGTPSEIKTKGKILFLEDVGEYLYNIDRMMLQLKRGGKLNKLSGLIIGGFTETRDTERPYGQSVYEIIHNQVKDYRYPVCFNFPISHTKENYAVKIGLPYVLDVREDTVLLKE